MCELSLCIMLAAHRQTDFHFLSCGQDPGGGFGLLAAVVVVKNTSSADDTTPSQNLNFQTWSQL